MPSRPQVSEECKLAALAIPAVLAGPDPAFHFFLQNKIRSQKAAASGQLAGELKGPGRWCPLIAMGLAAAW